MAEDAGTSSLPFLEFFPLVSHPANKVTAAIMHTSKTVIFRCIILLNRGRLEVISLGNCCYQVACIIIDVNINSYVIQLCKQDTKLHFDIAQKNTIIWQSEDDIPERLCNRIKATID